MLKLANTSHSEIYSNNKEIKTLQAKIEEAKIAMATASPTHASLYAARIASFERRIARLGK